jgi:hypothetical protein
MLTAAVPFRTAAGPNVTSRWLPPLNGAIRRSDPVTQTLTTDKLLDQLREPVQVTFTEVNTATVAVIHPRLDARGF